ncbi:MAG: leucine-rich repeat domain-containing protein, partial [Clostridia bacterium]|nr:leucine-rich repeat domain-containing protein [Clostridia bacterium]
PNIDVFPGDENAQSVWENNEYILVPKGSAANATYETFTLKFKVSDKELNVPQDTKVNLTIELKHTTPVEGTVEGTKLTTPDGIVYTINTTNNTASLEQKSESYYSVGDNYNSVEKANIAAIITDKTNHYRVTRIGDYAFSHSDFENNTKLKEVTIPNSIISIGEGALRNCTSLTYVKIPNSVTVCGDYLFCMDTNLGAVSLPNSISTIETSMFCASGITSIFIPNSVTTIEETAFGYCNSLTSLTIPVSVASISNTGMFEECGNLTTLVVAEGNKVYDSRNNCNAIIETSTNKLFLTCKTSVIPYGITIVGDGAFSRFSNLSTIIIPTSVKTIESCAFIYSSFTSIIIPYSVIEIGQWAFDGCEGLANVKLDSQTIVSGLTSLDAQGNIINYATSIYIKSDLDVTSATYLTNTANFTPEKVGDVVTDADGDGYILYTKVA